MAACKKAGFNKQQATHVHAAYENLLLIWLPPYVFYDLLTSGMTFKTTGAVIIVYITVVFEAISMPLKKPEIYPKHNEILDVAGFLTCKENQK